MDAATRRAVGGSDEPQSHPGLHERDEAGRYVYLNRAYEEAVCNSPRTGLQDRFRLLAPASAELFRANDADVLRSGQMQQFVEDATDLKAGGTAGSATSSPSPHPKAHATWEGLALTSSSGSRRKRRCATARKRLRRSEERYKLAVLSAGVGLWTGTSSRAKSTTRLGGRPCLVTRRTTLATASTTGSGSSIQTSGSESAKSRRRFSRVKARTITVEYRLRHQDGSYRWIEANGLAVRDPAQSGVRFVGSHGDINNRSRPRRRLPRSESNYRMLFESMDEGFCVIEVLFDGRRGRPATTVFLETNPHLCSTPASRMPSAGASRSSCRIMMRTGLRRTRRIAQTGKSERFENRAVALGRYYDVYAFRIGEPAQRRVAVLFTTSWSASERGSPSAHSRDRFELLSRTISRLFEHRPIRRPSWNASATTFARSSTAPSS